jgi:hypothetical protein
MLRNFLVVGLAGVCVLLASCSFEQSKRRAEPCVARFHEMLDGEQYHEIYAQADFQGSGNEVDATKLFGAVHRKLGAVKSSSVIGWHVNSPIGGNPTVVLACSTEFDRGAGTETFTVVVDGPQCQLRGYNITSSAFVAD